MVTLCYMRELRMVGFKSQILCANAMHDTGLLQIKATLIGTYTSVLRLENQNPPPCSASVSLKICSV